MFMRGKSFRNWNYRTFFNYESWILGFVVQKNIIWLSWNFFFFSKQKDDNCNSEFCSLFRNNETTEQIWLLFYMLSMKVGMYTWIFGRKTPRIRNEHGMWYDQLLSPILIFTKSFKIKRSQAVKHVTLECILKHSYGGNWVFWETREVQKNALYENTWNWTNSWKQCISKVARFSKLFQTTGKKKLVTQSSQIIELFSQWNCVLV